MKRIFSIILLAVLISCYSRDPEKTGMEGKIVPVFKILLVDSSANISTANIPSNASFAILCIGPHCPYSHAQMKEIIAKHEKLKNINLYIITSSSIAEMKQFSNEYHLNEYKNITAGIDVTHAFADYFEYNYVPFIAIYGKDKKLRQVFKGEVYASQIKNIAEH